MPLNKETKPNLISNEIFYCYGNRKLSKISIPHFKYLVFLIPQ